MRKLSVEEKKFNLVRARNSLKNKLHRKNKRRQSTSKKPVHYSLGIEKFCSLNNISSWKRNHRGVIKIDSSTNLYDNPEKLIELLLDLLSNAKLYESFPKVIFSGRIKFGTLYLFDNICWEIARKRKWGFNYQNMDKEDLAIYSKLRTFYSGEYENDNVYLLNEKVHINRSTDLLAKQQFKIKSKEITDMVIRGVRENYKSNFELSPEAYQAISSTIGEHFDNILQHVPEAEFGYLSGFYDKKEKVVHILIFNFGKTIYDSLVNANLPKQIKDQISAVIESHSKKKFFNLIDGDFTEENAITLLSLQEGISSRIEFDKSRGHGITDFIEHCFNLNSGTQISLISGRTAIKIDNKYKLERSFFIDRERRIIAFNEESDLFSKPDSKYVKNMKFAFPGLIIETRIPLNI